jgi:exosortase A-associated hydrolase 2
LSQARLAGCFLGPPGRRTFVLQRGPAMRNAEGCVLVVPPFAEEMNKSRKLIADSAVGLAEMGQAVVLPDLYGTGDSEGDFGDADIEHWLDDLDRVCQWCEVQGHPVTRLLAIRFGCAIAAEAARRGVLPPVERSALWQPVLDGERLLGQFLRLRVAAAMMQANSNETVAGLRSRLASGESVEVAGYAISPRLARGLEASKVVALPKEFGRVTWLEVTGEPNGEMPLPAGRAVERTRSDGIEVDARCIVGEPFWSTVEIARNPALVQATVAALVQVAA